VFVIKVALREVDYFGEIQIRERETERKRPRERQTEIKRPRERQTESYISNCKWGFTPWQYHYGNTTHKYTSHTDEIHISHEITPL
jgi:hypothetical protein